MKQTEIGGDIAESCPVLGIEVSYAPRLRIGVDSRKPTVKPRSGQGSVLHSIFISYRRDDSEGEAGRLSDDLEEIFQQDSIFMDVNAIQPGRDFRKAIDESIHRCSVLLAILGPSWLDCRNASGQRRLEDESDFLRLELVSALERDIPVIPVLIRGTKMPRADQLPDSLKELAFRNAVELTHARWKSDLQVLVRALRPYMQTAAECVTPPAVATVAVSEPSVPGMEKAALERVIRELATYIGPIAEIVVKRAAKRSASLPELCDVVSREIASAADQAKFLAVCRK